VQTHQTRLHLPRQISRIRQSRLGAPAKIGRQQNGTNVHKENGERGTMNDE
jgi:hypothetical protein